MTTRVEDFTDAQRVAFFAGINPSKSIMRLPLVKSIAALTIAASITHIAVDAYAAPGDTGSSMTLRRAIASEYALPEVQTSADGAKWIYAANELTPLWFGGKADATGVHGVGTDNTVAINNLFKTAAAVKTLATVPSGIWRVAQSSQTPPGETAIGMGYSGALFYRDKSRIRFAGRVIHDVYDYDTDGPGPDQARITIALLGYATATTANGRPGRATDVDIEFVGEGCIVFPDDPVTESGKMGVHIVNTDGCVIRRTRTSGVDVGAFQFTVTRSTNVQVYGGVLGAPTAPTSAGEDGFHVISSEDVTCSDMIINGGDDAISLTAEGGDTLLSVNTFCRNITFNNMLLRSAQARCIKFHIDEQTTGAVIEKVRFNNVYGLASGTQELIEADNIIRGKTMSPAGNGSVAMLVDGRWGNVNFADSNGKYASTNAAGYAVGATVLTLSGTGSGSIRPGHSISFDAGVTKYNVAAVSNTNVATPGATITLSTGLKTAIPAAATEFRTFNDRSFIRDITYSNCEFDIGTNKWDEDGFGGTGRGHAIFVMDCENVHFRNCEQNGSARSKICFDRSSGSFEGRITGKGYPMRMPTGVQTGALPVTSLSNTGSGQIVIGGSPDLSALETFMAAQLAKAEQDRTYPFVTLAGMNSASNNGVYIVTAVSNANKTMNIEFRRPGLVQEASTAAGTATIGISKRPDIVILGCTSRVKIVADIDGAEGAQVVYVGASPANPTYYSGVSANARVELSLSNVTKGEAIRVGQGKLGYYAVEVLNGRSQGTAIVINASGAVAEASNIIGDSTDFAALENPQNGYGRMLSTAYGSDKINTLRGRVPSKFYITRTQQTTEGSFVIAGNTSAVAAGPYASINAGWLTASCRTEPVPFTVVWDQVNAWWTLTAAAPSAARIWDINVAPPV